MRELNADFEDAVGIAPQRHGERAPRGSSSERELNADSDVATCRALQRHDETMVDTKRRKRGNESGVSTSANLSLTGHCEQHCVPADSSDNTWVDSQPVMAGVGNTVAPTTVGYLAPEANLFLELFAGEAKLTQAVRDAGCSVETPLEKRSTAGAHSRLDFTAPEVFSEINKKARQQQYKWIHAAPPCSSFSRARRTDKWGSVPILRSDEFPMGLPGVTHPKLGEANEIVRLLSRLVRTQHRAGQGWSIENPANSLIWQTTQFRQLAALPAVGMVVFDQCCHGSDYKKPTGLLTNMACFEQLAKRCPGQPAHPIHPPLVGKPGIAAGIGCGKHPWRQLFLRNCAKQWQSATAKWPRHPRGPPTQSNG